MTVKAELYRGGFPHYNLPHQTFMAWLRINTKSTENNVYHPEHIQFDVQYLRLTDQKPYLSDVITSEDIFSWEPETPVLISSQTGSGKKYFVIQSLLKPSIKDPNQKDTMLLLVNRQALNRQNKFDLAEFLKDVIGIEKYEKALNEYYKNEGIDNLFIDFGAITICTYHQCYKRQLLKNKRFKYIILDECHFFTSDSTFNIETDLMLEDIVNNGQPSVRIYMSATPEVALEPIINFEYNFKKNIVDSLTTQWRDIKTSPDFAIKLANKSVTSKDCYNIDAAIDKEREHWKIEFKFYYITRDYRYLYFQSTYSQVEDLIPDIQKSKNKWLIFINDSEVAKNFKKTLCAQEISCEFISRDFIKSNVKAKEEYDYLIENETSRQKVLIATSLIDNGINIKNDNIKSENDKVLNIAIDSTDRTQFLQMIGRVRVSENDQINLYIREYTLEDIKKNLEKDTKALITILYNDFLNRSEQKAVFDKNLFRYIDNDSDNFSTYNVCSVHQLINHIATLLKIFRNNDPDFYIQVSKDVDTIRKQLYLNYVNNKNNSRAKIWCRTIIDIIESEHGAEMRKKWALEELKRQVVQDRFKSTITDTFTKYIFAELLTGAVNQDFENDLQLKLESFGIKKDHYDTMRLRAQYEKQKSSLSIYDKIEVLKKLVDRKNLDYVQIFENHWKKYTTDIELFQWITNDSEISLLESQFKWLERPDLSEAIFARKSSTIETDLNNNSTIEDYIKKHYVTNDDFEKNKRGVKKDKADHHFLEKHAILKDSAEAHYLSKKFFDDKPLTSHLHQKWTVENDSYELKSILADNYNKTYYLFVKLDKTTTEEKKMGGY